MDRCEVLVVGGGPGGAACAWRLRQAGVDVLVADRAAFPRDKVCAGWITPQVIADLQLDAGAYGQTRTFQPFTAFRVGLIGAGRTVDAAYDRPVSFGIRRSEFDHFLLQRSGARLLVESPVSRIRREGGWWILDERVRAPMLVGAGGHFCPVARMLGDRTDRASVVAAQETEYPLAARAGGPHPVDPERPELYFSHSLSGYGWCVRKQGYLNVGFGSLDHRGLPAARSAFLAFLQETRGIGVPASARWCGHAYLLSALDRRPVVGDAVLLVGDAAGLAYPQSGEGIRPAIESGLLAAATILEADGRYERERLAAYEGRLRRRFGTGGPWRSVTDLLSPRVGPAAARWLLRSPAFVRHVVLNRWFLHAHEPALCWSAS